MPDPRPRPDDPHTADLQTDARRRLRLPTFGLSMTQLIATGLAAITATVAASFLGVTGTVVGAALASMTTAVGNAVYGHSLRRGRERVQNVMPGHVTRHLEAEPPARPRPRPTSRPPADVRRAQPAPENPPQLPAARPVRSLVWKRVAFGAVGVFVAVLAVVTGVELVAGRPIADVVRGDSGSGTSFFGDAQVRTRTVTPAAPTTTVTVTPKIVTTTPTITQTAPAATRTATSGTTTVSPSTSSSATGTATPTTSASTSASASGSAGS